MKDFIATFAIILVILVIFLFLGGALILEHFWLMVVIVAFVVALIVFAFMKLSDRIDELEKKLEIIESEKKDG